MDEKYYEKTCGDCGWCDPYDTPDIVAKCEGGLRGRCRRVSFGWGHGEMCGELVDSDYALESEHSPRIGRFGGDFEMQIGEVSLTDRACPAIKELPKKDAQ